MGGRLRRTVMVACNKVNFLENNTKEHINIFQDYSTITLHQIDYS